MRGAIAASLVVVSQPPNYTPKSVDKLAEKSPFRL